jgi:molybdenum transport protein
MPSIPDRILDDWLQEDAAFGLDLTTRTLALRSTPARITFSARHPLAVCGTEEAARLLQKLGASPATADPHAPPLASGISARPGDVILSATGPVEALHLGWKVCANLLEHASGIATRTRQLVDAARAASPPGRPVSIAATRKSFPGTKAVALKAVLAGGGIPHRLGLSETVLVFAQHRAFFPSDADFAGRIRTLKAAGCEKKFIVEADTAAEAFLWSDAGADGVQFDKLPPAELAPARPPCAPAIRICSCSPPAAFTPPTPPPTPPPA